MRNSRCAIAGKLELKPNLAYRQFYKFIYFFAFYITTSIINYNQKASLGG